MTALPFAFARRWPALIRVKTKNPVATDVFLVSAIITLMSGGITHSHRLRKNDEASRSDRM